MKGCIVKHSYYPNFSWESKRYSDALDMLKAFPFRSQNIGLVEGLEADIWVIGGRNKDYRAGRDDPAGVEALYLVHKTVSWAAVPWEKYDIAISCEPIIPDSIIRAHPETLWVYNEPSHRCGRSQRAARGIPCGSYDLFWDDYMRASKILREIPQSVSFPYFMKPGQLKELIKPVNEPSVWIDSRHIVYESPVVRDKMCRELSSICGLLVKHSPIPGQWSKDKKVTDRILLAMRKMSTAIEYLKLLGSCKYFLVWRDREVQGQAALEAAALGLIVLANENGVYHQMLCHPYCMIPSGGPPRIGLRKIKKIEKNKGLQQEILEHQNTMLETRFWSRPMMILCEALAMKREKIAARDCEQIIRKREG